jgi:hypothetical protein
MQALIRWLLELAIISNSEYERWCIRFNQMGWRRQEPHELEHEESAWLGAALARCRAERLITPEEEGRLLGSSTPMAEDVPSSRRGLLGLPADDRRAVLARQAAEIAELYQEDPSWRELQGGNVIEYDTT